jgi:1,4-dihydroxy-2-naphthoyl-CoA synthase
MKSNEKHMRVAHVAHVACSVLLKVSQAIFNQSESKQNSFRKEMMEIVT